MEKKKQGKTRNYVILTAMLLDASVEKGMDIEDVWGLLKS